MRPFPFALTLTELTPPFLPNHHDKSVFLVHLTTVTMLERFADLKLIKHPELLAHQSLNIRHENAKFLSNHSITIVNVRQRILHKPLRKTRLEIPKYKTTAIHQNERRAPQKN
jgi:hypothetical protein